MSLFRRPAFGVWSDPYRRSSRHGGRQMPGSFTRVATTVLMASLLLWALPARAQRGLAHEIVDTLSPNVVMEQWGMAQGLPQSSVLRLVTDAQGYVWGATFGGLFRFDGRVIEASAPWLVDQFDGDAVTALATRGDGVVLAGTNRGRILVTRNGQVVDALPVAPFQPGATIDELYIDQGGVLWARALLEVAAFHEGRWTRAPDGYTAVTQFGELATGEIVYAGPRGLVRGRPGALRLERLEIPVAFTGERQGLYVDPLDRIWIGGGAPQVIDGPRAHRLAGIRGIVTTIMADATGRVWVGSVDGLYQIPRGSAPVPGLRAELVAGLRVAVLSVARTPDDLLVVGTRGGGILMLRERPVRVVPFRLAGDLQATTVITDHEGQLWAASSCSDLHRFGASGVWTDTFPRAPRAGCIRAATRDARGRLWIAIDGWIRRRPADRRNANRQIVDWALPRVGRQPMVARLLLAVGDTVYAGLSDGRIARVDPDDRLRLVRGWTQPTGQAIESMAIATDGTIWVGQSGRLTGWHGATRREFGAAVGVPAAVPRVLVPDSGGVWFGTYGAGLRFLDLRGASPQVRRLPLRDPTVSGMVRDSTGRVWMPGNRGITVVTYAAMRRWVTDSAARPDFLLLGMSDGVPEGNYGQPAATLVGANEVVTASIDGIVRTPVGLDRMGGTPPVRIDEIRTASRTVAARSPLQLSAQERQITVTFSVPTYRFSDEALFRYRLVGRDGAWIALDDTRQLQLAGLDPGGYTLELEGRIPGGGWRAASPLQLEVAPLWHERWLVRLALLGFMAGAFGMMARQRWRAVRAEVRAREVEWQARREVAEQVDRHRRELAQVGRVAVAGELTASLSHELGQPLAAIVNNAAVARRLAGRLQGVAGGEADALDEVLRDVVSEGHRASQVVREFRRFLRREPVDATALVVPELVDSVVVLMRQEYAAAGVALRVHRPARLPTLFGERVLVQQVLVNLLQNALEAVRRAAPSGGTVLLRVRRAGAGIRFSVADTGTGFDPAVRATAFEPFVTGRLHGMGMGLAIARRIVEAHEGHIGLGRLRSAGAVVSVWLPLAPAVPIPGTDRLLPAQVTAHG